MYNKIQQDYILLYSDLLCLVLYFITYDVYLYASEQKLLYFTEQSQR